MKTGGKPRRLGDLDVAKIRTGETPHERKIGVFVRRTSKYPFNRRSSDAGQRCRLDTFANRLPLRKKASKTASISERHDSVQGKLGEFQIPHARALAFILGVEPMFEPRGYHCCMMNISMIRPRNFCFTISCPFLRWDKARGGPVQDAQSKTESKGDCRNHSSHRSPNSSGLSAFWTKRLRVSPPPKPTPKRTSKTPAPSSRAT